jgi:hypothetical protein
MHFPKHPLERYSERMSKPSFGRAWIVPLAELLPYYT